MKTRKKQPVPVPLRKIGFVLRLPDHDRFSELAFHQRLSRAALTRVVVEDYIARSATPAK